MESDALSCWDNENWERRCEIMCFAIHT